MAKKIKQECIFDHFEAEEIDFDISHIVWKDGPGFVIKEKMEKFMVITGRRDYTSFPHREKKFHYHTIIVDPEFENYGDAIPLVFNHLYGCKTTTNLRDALKLHFSTIKFLSRLSV